MCLTPPGHRVLLSGLSWGVPGPVLSVEIESARERVGVRKEPRGSQKIIDEGDGVEAETEEEAVQTGGEGEIDTGEETSCFDACPIRQTAECQLLERLGKIRRQYKRNTRWCSWKTTSRDPGKDERVVELRQVVGATTGETPETPLHRPSSPATAQGGKE